MDIVSILFSYAEGEQLLNLRFFSKGVREIRMFFWGGGILTGG